MDLSPLADSTHYALAEPTVDQKYRDKQYLISVCKPLPATALNRCPGAAVCDLKDEKVRSVIMNCDILSNAAVLLLTYI